MIRNDLTNIVTQLTHESNQLQDTLAQINLIVSGTPSGIDRVLLDEVRTAIVQISKALTGIYSAANAAENFDVMEEVPDEEYY